ncbi:hypothetical protein MTO96_048678 [Rhipicephalus appendiculatus]
MATFTSPSQRPPRVKHRRHASLSLVARTPSTLDEEFSARIELERRSRISLDDWLRDLTAIDFAQPAPSSGAQDPAANAPATPALAEPVNPAALVTTQDCSRAVLRDSSLAERIGVPLPASDDEESMDMSSSRKRAREDSCDEDAQGPRKQLPTDYPADLPDDRGDDGPHTSIAATSSDLESSADTSDTSVAPSPSAGNAPVAPAPAASQLQETDGMEASTEAEEHDAAQEHVSSAPPNPAAAFMRDPPCIANVVTRKKLKKKKNKKRRQAGKQNRPSATPGASTCNNTTPCTALAVATTRIEEREIPWPLRDPMLVSSRAFHRRLFTCSPRYRLPEHLGVTLPLLPPRHSPPAAPSAQPSVDVLLANLLVTMQAVGAMLPADHPLRAVFLQAAAVQSSSTNHG